MQKGHLVVSDVVSRFRAVDTTNGTIVTGRDSASASSAERSRLNKSSIVLCYCAGSVPNLWVTALVMGDSRTLDAFPMLPAGCGR